MEENVMAGPHDATCKSIHQLRGPSPKPPAPPLPVHIRWMIRRDMPAVLAIEQECFEFPWYEADFGRRHRRPPFSARRLKSRPLAPQGPAPSLLYLFVLSGPPRLCASLR